MNDTPSLPSDRQLVDAARDGHDAAWDELLERHRPAVVAVLAGRRRSAGRSISEQLEQSRSTLAEAAGTGPDESVVRAFRPRAMSAVTGGTFGPGRADSTDAERLLARAFGRLPEPWQAVLWHTHVERLTSAEVSPLVGRATSEVSDLLGTAERGLVDAFSLEILDDGRVDDETAQIVPLLSGYVRETLPPQDHARVQRYFERDDDTSTTDTTTTDTTIADTVIEVAQTLAQALPPAIAPGVTGLSVAQHRERLGTTDRSFGAAALFADRSDRTRRAVVVASVAVVLLALVGIVAVLRPPSDVSVSSPDTGATSTSDDPNVLTSEPGADPGATAPVPATTELPLRPVTGPSNTIRLVVDDGLRPLGFAPNTSGLVTTVSSPAPIFAGGTGTLDIAVTNDGDQVAEASFETELPRGVVLEERVSGDADCVDPDDDSPFCNVMVEPGATVEVSLRLALESAVVGRIEVVGDSLAEPFEAQVEVTPDLIHNSVGNGGAAVIGNTVMTCADALAVELDISCDAVRAGDGPIVNRWDVPMQFVGAAPEFGMTNGSSAVLDVPEGSTIVHAHLFWSGDLDQNDQVASAGSEDTVTVSLPDASSVEVTAQEIKFGEEDASQYVGRAEVTDIVAGTGAGSYLVGNIASVETRGSYGAWALVVVYDHDDEPRRFRVVTDPFDWVAPDAPFDYAVDLPVPPSTGASARLDVVGYEGELGFEPEFLVVGDRVLADGNPFDSSIVGERTPSIVNNLGVDIDTYDLDIDAPDGILGIDATSDNDGIRLAVLALSIDLDR